MSDVGSYKDKISYWRIIANNNPVSFAWVVPLTILVASGLLFALAPDFAQNLWSINFLLPVALIIFYFAFKTWRSIKYIQECFDGRMAEATLEHYTNSFVSLFFCRRGVPNFVIFSYSIDGKSYEIKEKITSSARDVIAAKYEKGDKIKIMISAKNNGRACIYEIYS